MMGSGQGKAKHETCREWMSRAIRLLYEYLSCPLSPLQSSPVLRTLPALSLPAHRAAATRRGLLLFGSAHHQPEVKRSEVITSPASRLRAVSYEG